MIQDLEGVEEPNKENDIKFDKAYDASSITVLEGLEAVRASWNVCRRYRSKWTSSSCL